MDGLQVRALLVGIAFGVWPLLLRKSGLNGNVSSAVFATLVCACLLPFGLRSLDKIVEANWWLLAASGLLGAAGMLWFNGMMIGADDKKVGSLFVLMIVIQTAIPVAYHLIANGGLTASKGLGFLLAGVAATLLLL